MNSNTLKLRTQSTAQGASARLPTPRPNRGALSRQWVIWRRGGTRPKVRHTNLREALAEVARLRQLCPDERYDIFELVPLRNLGPRR